MSKSVGTKTTDGDYDSVRFSITGTSHVPSAVMILIIAHAILLTGATAA